MLDLKVFIVLRLKPKNGGFERESSRLEFWRLHGEPDTITDEKGAREGLRERIAYKAKDTIAKMRLVFTRS